MEREKKQAMMSLQEMAAIWKTYMESGSEKLTGTGILDRSFPMQFFMMLHRLNEMFGLSGIRCRRWRFAVETTSP